MDEIKQISMGSVGIGDLAIAVGIVVVVGGVCSASVLQISKLSLPVSTLDDDDDADASNHTAVPIRNSKHDHAMILFLPVNMRMPRRRRPLKR